MRTLMRYSAAAALILDRGPSTGNERVGAAERAGAGVAIRLPESGIPGETTHVGTPPRAVDFQGALTPA